MHSNNKNKKQVLMGVFALIIGIMACNLPGQSNAGNSSFDNAHLMMFANRSNLGFYDDAEVSSALPLFSISRISYQNRSVSQPSIEKINEHRLLAEEYRKLAEKARKTGNLDIRDVFRTKAGEHNTKANTLQDRVEWRRKRRFGFVVKRIGHGIGQALQFTMDNVAQGTEMVVTSYVDNYVEQVRNFVRNPLRYGFQHYVSIQLGILKDQFIDKAGPFFGSRAYEVIKVEEFAEKVEEEIFGEEHPQQPSAAVTPTDDDIEDAIVPVGTYEGKITLDKITTDDGITIVVKENSVVVNVAEDGTVSGKLKVSRYYPPHSECAQTGDVNYDGTFSGKLKDITGQIALDVAITSSIKVGVVNEYCGDYEVALTNTYMVKITVQKDTMIGDAQDANELSFTATKNEQ